MVCPHSQQALSQSTGATTIHQRVVESLSNRKSAQDAMKASNLPLENQQPLCNSSISGSRNHRTSAPENNSDHLTSDPSSYHFNSDMTSHISRQQIEGGHDASAVMLPTAGVGNPMYNPHRRSTLQGSHITLENSGLAGTEQLLNPTGTPPFQGYSLEELWNWMLLTDSGGNMGEADIGGWLSTDF